MKSDRVFAGVVIYVASLFTLELLTLWIGDVGLMSCLVTAVAALIACVYFSYIDRDIPGELLSRGRRMSWRECLSLAALIVAAQVISSYALYIIESLVNRAGLTTLYSPAVTIDYTATWSMILYSVIIGPLAEEVVFRGFIMRGLEEKGRTFAIVTQALLFSLMHGDINQLVFTFLVGIVLGFAAFEYSLGWAFLLHVFNNGVLGVMLGGLSTVFPAAAAVLIVVVFICGVVMSIYTLVRHFRGIIGYISEHRAVPGAYGSYRNRWFLVFIIFELFSVALTLVRV